MSHEVAKGETLESIADDFYGDQAAADYLRSVNGIPAGAPPAEGSMLEIPVGREDIERYERRTEAKLHYNRGTLLAERGDLERAAEEFRSALRADPRFADAGYNLGVVLLSLGETERAVVMLRQTAEARPGDPELSYALGAALMEAGRPAEALALFEDIVLLSPRHEDARFSRALALLELDREDEAVFYLDDYVREFPAGRWTESARDLLAELARPEREAD